MSHAAATRRVLLPSLAALGIAFALWSVGRSDGAAAPTPVGAAELPSEAAPSVASLAAGPATRIPVESSVDSAPLGGPRLVRRRHPGPRPAAFDLDAKDATTTFFALMAAPLDDQDSRGNDLGAAVLRCVTARAPQDARAAALLERLVLETRTPVRQDLRRRACADFARTGSEHQIESLVARLAMETDTQLVAGVVSALAENPAAASVTRATELIRNGFPLASNSSDR